LRLAAGICVLSTGLLIGSAGGAIASADTDTTASGVDGASAATTSATSEPAATAAAPTPGSTLQKSVTAFLGKLREEQSKFTKRLLATPEVEETETDKTGADLTEGEAAPLAADTTEVAPDSTEVAPVTDVAADWTDPMAPVSTVVEPVTNAVATVMSVVGTVPGVVAGLPSSETPVADVITSIEEMLTSVSEAAVPLVSVPSDLYTLLAGDAVAPATIGGGAIYRLGPVAAADTPLLPPVMPAWPQVLPSSDIWGVHGDVAAPATVGGVATAGLIQELSISGAAPLATKGVTPTGVLPALEHAVRALLVPASLSALAALALPGVGGLLIVCAAGIRLGYRQAKAGLMLRASGIARFAGPGPLGVVRSGSLIALRPRAVRVVRPAASGAACLVDEAA
jgi:hypothetical protein